jgi:hypothetical protein
MSKAPILFVGESHTIALAGALAAGGARSGGRAVAILDLRPFRPVVVEGPDGPAFAAGITGALREALRPDTAVVSYIGGNKHNTMSLIAHPVPFDFHLAGREDLGVDETAQLIPEAAVRESLESRMDSEIKAIELLRRSVGRRILHAETPPPLGDAAHILASADTFFRENGLSDLGVAPPRLRLKIWLLQRRILQDLCRRIDVGYLELPPEVFGADGLLSREGYGRDATHANPWFGAQVIRHVEHHLDGLPSAA